MDRKWRTISRHNKKFNRYLEKKENDKVLDKIKNEIKIINGKFKM